MVSFPSLPKDKIYTLGSFVHSIGDKIAFPESPDGTLAAGEDRTDPNGALTDYWILNLLRTVSYDVLMGSKTAGMASSSITLLISSKSFFPLPEFLIRFTSFLNCIDGFMLYTAMYQFPNL